MAGSGLVVLAGMALSACGGAATATTSSTAAVTSAAISAAASTPASSAAATTAVVATTSVASSTAATSASAAAVSAATSAASTAAPAASGSKAAAGIEYWHIFGGTDTATMNHMLDAFVTAHPDIPVQRTQLGFGNMAKKITTAIAGGTPPNVFMNGDAPVASAYGVLGVVKAVDAFAKQDGISADIFLQALQPTFVEAGKMWGLRFNTDVRPLYYNVNAFQEVGLDPAKPPTTWDELIAASKKLTKKAPDGTLQRVGWWPGYGQVFFYQLDRSNGGHLSDAAGSKVLFDDDAGVGVLDFVRQAANAVGAAAEYATFAKSFGSNAKDPFITGQVAMEFNGSWLKQTYTQYGADLNYKAALLPFPKKQVSISGGFTLSIPAASPANKDDASWQLLKFLCTDKTQQLYMAKTGQLSALVSLADDPYFQSDPILKVVAEQMKSTSLFPWQPPLSKLGSSLSAAVTGAIANTAPSKQLLDTAAQLTQAAIDQYNQQNPQWLQNFGK